MGHPGEELRLVLGCHQEVFIMFFYLFVSVGVVHGGSQPFTHGSKEVKLFGAVGPGSFAGHVKASEHLISAYQWDTDTGSATHLA